MLTVPKLYVGCGLTGAPEVFRDEVDALKETLKRKYEVFDFLGLVAGDAEDVYRWDIDTCVEGCDVLVGVCDYPSIGLGWEMSRAITLGKTVLGVAHSEANVTRLVLGAAVVEPNFAFEYYTDMVPDVSQMVDGLILNLQS